MKKWSGPGSVMNSLNVLEDDVWAERARNPSPVSSCDGCLRRFHGVPPEDTFDGGEGGEGEEQAEDAGDPFKRCKTCDFTICKDCSEPENQGTFILFISLKHLP